MTTVRTLANGSKKDYSQLHRELVILSFRFHTNYTILIDTPLVISLALALLHTKSQNNYRYINIYVLLYVCMYFDIIYICIYIYIYMSGLSKLIWQVYAVYKWVGYIL